MWRLTATIMVSPGRTVSTLVTKRAWVWAASADKQNRPKKTEARATGDHGRFR